MWFNIKKSNKFKNITLIIKTISTPGILTLSSTLYSEENIMFWKPDLFPSSHVKWEGSYLFGSTTQNQTQSN